MSLSRLAGQTFTIINQIPQSSTVLTRTQWKKKVLKDCGKKDGLYDRSSGTMAYKANTWTVFINDWEKYREPTFLKGGYYSAIDQIKNLYFTANVGDLIIFADIRDNAPSTLQEFNQLRDKYKDIGGVISSVEVYIRFKADGTPWKTNHIELIKG